MLRTDALLREAARSTLDRIQTDHRAASRQVAPLLSYIEEHLFHPDLTVGALLAATGTKNNLVPVTFHREVGLPPKAYIEDCRLAVAARLLRESDLKIWQIAHLVGYGSLQSFGRAFRRHVGELPSAYRKAQPSASEAPIPEAWQTLGFHLRALRGELPPEQAVPYMKHLHSHYGGSADGPELVVDGGSMERYHAEGLWAQIKDWTPEQQRACVTSRVAFRTPALFELLVEKSRIEGRRDRAQGVYLAELAVESIEGSASSLGERATASRAKGWAWVGNAHVLAVQFPEAERAFARAEAAWGELRTLRTITWTVSQASSRGKMW